VPPAIPEFGQPCASTINGPSPCSAMCILIPFTWMNRCLMLVIWVQIGDIAANLTCTPPRESKGGRHRILAKCNHRSTSRRKRRRSQKGIERDVGDLGTA
jgi:hypothetical protein